MPLKVIDATFVRSAPTMATVHDGDRSLPEIAFIGRSNVGKSSCINEMLGRKKLVKTSKTPGRTQEVNFFQIMVRDDESGEERQFHLTDLPGYGFARVSEKERLRMGALITAYVGGGPPLLAICQLFDIRHNPTADDRSIAAHIADLPLGHMLVATKIDKLAGAKRKPAIKKLASQLQRDPADVTGFSVLAHIGAEALLKRVWSALS